MKKYVVYRHRRLDDFTIFYVGIGSLKRANSKHSRNKYWKNITNKVLYSVEVLGNDFSLKDACELEMLLISEYGRKDLCTGVLVNMSNGGEGGFGYTPSTTVKIAHSARMSGEGNPNYNKPMSEEQKDKLRVERPYMRGENNHMYGKKGSLHPQYGKTGELAPNYGKTLPQEQKDMISMSLKRGNCVYAKLVLDLQTGIFYDCMKDAAEAYKINYSTLRSMLQGKNKNRTNLIYC